MPHQQNSFWPLQGERIPVFLYRVAVRRAIGPLEHSFYSSSDTVDGVVEDSSPRWSWECSLGHRPAIAGVARPLCLMDADGACLLDLLYMIVSHAV